MSNGSFTFCGVDVESLGLTYAPEMSQTFVYGPAEEQSHIETFDAHNGGYYYGSWRSVKEFILRCYFEETNIDEGIMAKIYSLFKVGKSGKLVFSRRPWCYYYATVTNPIAPEYTNYLNGIITVTLKAMYPFARSDVFVNERTEQYHDSLMSNSAVFDNEDMELPNAYDLTQQTSLILANPGTERAALGIAVSGDAGSGVIISNKTTGQSCKIIAITKQNTTDLNKKIIIDPISGKTILTGGGSNELAFKYHEYGFLELESSFPAVRDLYIDYEGSNLINVANILNEDLVGRYIFVNDDWHKIVEQPNKHSLRISEKINNFGSRKTMAVYMNEITITPITTMDIHLEFIFKPTYA